jgi:hypothetical protein
MALAFRHDIGLDTPSGVLWSSRRAHLVVVGAPSLTRPVRPSPEMYRRRRLVTGLVALVVTSLVVMGVAGLADRQVGVPAGRPHAVSGPVGAWLTAEEGVLRYVVAEGDSIWSAAQRLQASHSSHALVEQLVAVNGSARVVPGQVLEVRP